MSRFKIIAAVTLLVGLGVPASALDLQEGIHGMRWNRAAAEFPHLTRVREAGPVAYYVPSDTRYQVADLTVPAVVYGFFRGRLFAAYIKLGSALQFTNMEHHFRGRYGAPKTDHDAAGKSTVLRWHAGDVNVKLKMRAPARDIKMAVYYLPLAAELTQAQVDDIPAEAYPQDNGGGAPSEAMKPLLE